VERAILQRDLEVEQRESTQRPLLLHDLEALLDGGNEFLRDLAADDLGLEHEPFARLGGLDGVFDLCELTRTTGLLLVRVGVLHRLRHRLAVGDLRRADVDRNAVATAQNVDLDVEVELAHPLEDRLAGLLVDLDVEGRVLGNHLAKSSAELLAHGLVFCADRKRNHWVGEDHRLQGGRVLLVGERVTGAHVLEANHGHDVTGLRRIHDGSVVGVHLDHAADALVLAGERVDQGVALIDRARVDAGEGQRTKTVFHDLERKRTHGSARIDQREASSFVAFEVDLGLRRNFRRVGQVVDDRVEHLLDALVLESGPAISREKREVARARTNALLDRFKVRLVALEVLLHRVIVLLDGGFDELETILFDELFHVLGDFLHLEVLGLAGVVPDVRLTREEVDDADEVRLGSDGEHHDERLGAEDVLDLVDDAVEVRTQAVELVDKNQTCDLRVIGVTPVRLGLGLDTAGTAEHAHTAVEHLE
jgi:hypothetical protein